MKRKIVIALDEDMARDLVDLIENLPEEQFTSSLPDQYAQQRVTSASNRVWEAINKDERETVNQLFRLAQTMLSDQWAKNDDHMCKHISDTLDGLLWIYRTHERG